MKQIAALSLVLPLLACSPAPTAGDPGTQVAAAPGPYAFDVQLTLTPRAAEKLVGFSGHNGFFLACSDLGAYVLFTANWWLL